MKNKIALAATVVALMLSGPVMAQNAEPVNNPDQSGTTPGTHAQAPATGGKSHTHKKRHTKKKKKDHSKDNALQRGAHKAGAAIEKGAVKTRDAIRHTGEKINAATAPAGGASGAK